MNKQTKLFNKLAGKFKMTVKPSGWQFDASPKPRLSLEDRRAKYDSK